MNVLSILVLTIAVTGRVFSGGIRVETPGGILTSAALEAAVRGHLRDGANGGREERVVGFQSTPDTLRTGGAVCWIEPGIAPGAPLRGSVTMPVVVTGESGTSVTVTLLAVVRTFSALPVASRRLERHAELASGDWVLRRVETTTLPAGVVRDAGALAGRRTSRLVEEGSLYFERLLEPVPLVKRGDRVTLLVRRGAIRLTATAVAREDGAEGVLISVRREGVAEPVRARVLDGRTVAMDVR
jgi:flagella basal body P-ring formation protein FlgA